MKNAKIYIPKYSRDRQNKRQLISSCLAVLPEKDFEVTINLGYAYQHVSSSLITLDHLDQIQNFSDVYLHFLKAD